MLRRITLSLAFASCVGVAAAQTVPNLAWSLFAPRDVPTVEWSSTGANVVLTTNSSVELLSGSTNQLVWSRQVTGAEPPIAQTYGYSDRAHFSPDGTSVWVRSATGSTFSQISTTTGLTIRTHAFTDWTTDFLLQPVGSELVAYNVTLSGSTFTYNIRTYDSTSLALLTTQTLTHAEGPGYSGLTIPIGTYGGTDTAFFYNQGVNARTGAITTFGTTGTTEPWTVAVDPQGGLLQAVMSVSGSNYTLSSVQRVTTTSTTWSTAADVLPANIGPSPSVGFLSNTATPVAIGPTSTGVGAFNYMTGTPLWAKAIGTAAFTYQPQALNPVGGQLLISTGNANFAVATMDTFAVSAAGLGASTQIPAVQHGMAGSASVPGGAILDGNSNFLSGVTSADVSNWFQTNDGGPTYVAASPLGDLAAIVVSGGMRVINTATGATVASFSGGFTGFAWNSETTLFAFRSDNSAQELSLSGSTLTSLKTYPTDFYVGHTATTDGKFAVGYGTGSGSGQIYVFDLAAPSFPPTQTAYPQFTAPWQDSFRMMPTNDGSVAMLEQTSAGAEWSIYHFAANPGGGAVVALNNSFTYTAPFTRASGDRVRGDITPDQVVAAYFIGTSVGLDGTPTSELAFVRLSDGKVLSKIDNVFSYVNQMHFSTDRSLLYVTTGGASATGTVSSDNAGPSDLQVLNVPAWITGISAAPSSVPSGGSTTVSVTISAPAQTGGQVVNLSGTTGMTVPLTLTVAAGQTTGTANVTCPAVATTTTCKVTASITGLGESSSVSITDNPPFLSGFALTASTIEAGSQTTGTVTITGTAPTNGWSINLAQATPTNSLVSFPASVNVLAGQTTAQFTIKTVSSTNSSSATINATQSTNAFSATLNLTPTVIISTVFESTSVTGGDAVAVKVTIGEPAAPGGMTLGLTAASPVTFPATVTIPAGATQIEITGTTIPVASSTTVNFSAALGAQTGGASVTVLPPTVLAVQFGQHVVIGGASVPVYVLLSGGAASGTNLTLNSTSTRLQAPATAPVTAGSATATYSLKTLAGPSISVTLTISLGTSSAHDALSIHL